MKYFPRLAVTIYPLIIWLLSEVYFFEPNSFYMAVGASLLLTVALTFYLKQPSASWPWWFATVLPSAFLGTGAVYASLQVSKIVVQLIFLLVVIFLFIYFKNLYYQYRRPDLYAPEEFELVKSFGGLLIVFFSSASLLGLKSLLNLTAWPMFLVFATIILAVVFINLEGEVTNRRTVWQFSLITTFLLAEEAIVFLMLPLQYNVAALCLAIIYYLIISLTKLYFRQALTGKKIRYYLLASYSGITLALLTARWFN